MIDALLLSTSPASSPMPCANPKSMSVATFDAFFGHATQRRPAVSSAAAIRSNQRIISACSVANSTPTSSGFASFARSAAPSGMGVSSRSNPSGGLTRKTREPSLMPSFFGSGVPE